MANIVDEMIKVDVCEVELDGNQSIVGLITKLQAALDMVPSEFRDVATVHFAAYDWEGVFVEYDRPPTEEERAAADAVFADRQKLIQATSASDMEQWIRKLRLRYLSLTGGPGESLTREEAMKMIVNDEEVETTMRKTANNDFENLAPVEHEALPALSCMQHKTKRGVMSRHHP